MVRSPTPAHLGSRPELGQLRAIRRSHRAYPNHGAHASRNQPGSGVASASAQCSLGASGWGPWASAYPTAFIAGNDQPSPAAAHSRRGRPVQRFVSRRLGQSPMSAAIEKTAAKTELGMSRAKASPAATLLSLLVKARAASTPPTTAPTNQTIGTGRTISGGTGLGRGCTSDWRAKTDVSLAEDRIIGSPGDPRAESVGARATNDQRRPCLDSTSD